MPTPWGLSGKKINYVCQKWCHDQQTRPESQSRIWGCQCTQWLRFWSPAGESGPISRLWGAREGIMLLHQNLSSQRETCAIRKILNSVLFAFHCKIHELLSSLLYLNILYTFKNYKINRNGNHLHLWSNFPPKSPKLQNSSIMFSGKSIPLKLKILLYQIKWFMDHREEGW